MAFNQSSQTGLSAIFKNHFLSQFTCLVIPADHTVTILKWTFPPSSISTTDSDYPHSACHQRAKKKRTGRQGVPKTYKETDLLGHWSLSLLHSRRSISKVFLSFPQPHTFTFSLSSNSLTSWKGRYMWNISLWYNLEGVPPIIQIYSVAQLTINA